MPMLPEASTMKSVLLEASETARAGWLPSPWMEAMAQGVVVATPNRLVEVLTVMTLEPAASWISKALPDEVAILKGSEIIREAYCPPMALRVVVPEASVWKAR